VLRDGRGTPTPQRGFPPRVGSEKTLNEINSFYRLGFLY